ncbi:MAG: L-lactate dehydrogenase [Brevinemataceae bacterium]
MNNMSRKVAVIGVGNVGLGTAITIVQQGIADELLLIDRNVFKTEGEALDLENAMPYFSTRTKVRLATMADVSDVNIICIAASAAPPSGGDRLAELEFSSKIVRSIVREAMDNGFNGIFLIQTNPVDIMTFHALDESGLPPQKVIGTGTSLDSARLRQVIASMSKNNIDIRSVTGYSLGEHGDSQAIIWSSITIGGKPYLSLREEKPEIYAKHSLEEIQKTILKMAWDIVDRKGNTAYGIGSAAVRIMKAVFQDEKFVLPVSVYLNGEYGQKDIVASVPAVLGQDGVLEVIEIPLSDSEKAKLDKSFATLKKYCVRKNS